MKKKAIAVFISGRGSNLKSIIDACNDIYFPGFISIVISDNKNALGLEYAKKENISYKVFEISKFESKDQFEEAILNELKDRNIKLICLAGYMKILSKNFIKDFKNKIINIHPSLLPKFKGLNTHERVIESSEVKSGCTVHYVEESLDDGEIIKQMDLDIMKDDTPEKLNERILKLEHKLYPDVIKKILMK